MSRRLFVCLIVVAVIEIWGIFMMVRWIGGWPTFGLIILTGIGGAWLARAEGRKVWADAVQQLGSGQMPGWAILDGLCVLGGGVLLMLPGFITDVAGLTLLFPFTRKMYRYLLYGVLERKVRSGQWTIRRGPPQW